MCNNFYDIKLGNKLKRNSIKLLVATIVISTSLTAVNIADAEENALLGNSSKPAQSIKPYIACDNLGNIYVANANSKRICRIGPSGNMTTITGDNTLGYFDSDGKHAQFKDSYDIKGIRSNLYVADTLDNLIRKINALPHDSRSPLRFLKPYCVACDSSGNFYVGHHYNYLIRQLALKMASDI